MEDEASVLAEGEQVSVSQGIATSQAGRSAPARRVMVMAACYGSVTHHARGGRLPPRGWRPRNMLPENGRDLHQPAADQVQGPQPRDDSDGGQPPDFKAKAPVAGNMLADAESSVIKAAADLLADWPSVPATESSTSALYPPREASRFAVLCLKSLVV